MVGCNTAADVWKVVDKTFALQSQAKAMQHKLQFPTLKKGGLSMTEYLLKMTVSEHDQIRYILSGWGVEYESVVVSITSRVEPYSLTDVRALFFAHESRFESYSVNSVGSQPTANVAFQNTLKREILETSDTILVDDSRTTTTNATILVEDSSTTTTNSVADVVEDAAMRDAPGLGETNCNANFVAHV